MKKIFTKVFNFFQMPMKLRIELFNILTREKIPVNNLLQPHWTSFINAIDPKMKIPKPTSFNTEFFQSAYSALTEDEASEHILPALVIQADKFESEIFFFGTVMSRSGKYYRVNSFIEKNESFDDAFDDERFDHSLKGFTERCMVAAELKYTIKIRFVIFDFHGAENSAYIHEESDRILKSVSLSQYLKKIKNERINIDPIEGAQKCLDFKEFLIQFEKNVVDNQISLAAAAHEIIKAIKMDVLTLQKNWGPTLKLFVSSLMIGCSFLDPNFKMELQDSKDIEPFADAGFLLDDFIFCAVPEDSHEAIADYRVVDKVFKYCEKKNITNPTKYWNTAKSLYPTLANFSLDVLAIPAAPKASDLKSLHTFHKQVLNNTMDEIEYNYHCALMLK